MLLRLGLGDDGDLPDLGDTLRDLPDLDGEEIASLSFARLGFLFGRGEGSGSERRFLG
jgi:hypothetical protein